MAKWREYHPTIKTSGSWLTFDCACGRPLQGYATPPQETQCPTCGRYYTCDVTMNVTILTRGRGNRSKYTPPGFPVYHPVQPPESDEPADFTHLHAVPH